MAKYTTTKGSIGDQSSKPFQLQQLQDGNSLLTNNFSSHSKSHKPVEFKKIQNLSVKAGGQVAVTNIQNN